MYEWILSCKKALRLFLRRIYINKKTYRERGLTRPLHNSIQFESDVHPEGRPRCSCITNLYVLIILIACYLFLMPSVTKAPSYSEKSIEKTVLVNPNQVMRVNVPKEMKLELARKWLARNVPKTKTTTEGSTKKPQKSFLEQARLTSGNVIIIDDNETSSTTTMAPIEAKICLTRVWPEKVIVNTSVAKISLDNIYPMVQSGGYYKPTECVPMHKVAILVPYRNRTRNLTTFLINIHPFLMTQNLEYQIFVIEQFGNNKFNKGRLFNAGFKEMKKFGSWHCVVFHDVDLLPMDRRIFYTCPTVPRHMSSRVLDSPSDRLWRRNTSSPILFGGVTAMRLVHYEMANGHSNMYWGWGGEDYDMFWRIRAAKIPIVRYNKTIARYIALPHPRAEANLLRYSLIQSAIDRWQAEGLNTINYRVVSSTRRHLFTHIVVNIEPFGDTKRVQDMIKAVTKTENGVKHRRRDPVRSILSALSLNQIPTAKRNSAPVRTTRARQSIPPVFPIDYPPIITRWG